MASATWRWYVDSELGTCAVTAGDRQLVSLSCSSDCALRESRYTDWPPLSRSAASFTFSPLRLRDGIGVETGWLRSAVASARRRLLLDAHPHPHPRRCVACAAVILLVAITACCPLLPCSPFPQYCTTVGCESSSRVVQRLASCCAFCTALITVLHPPFHTSSLSSLQPRILLPVLSSALPCMLG